MLSTMKSSWIVGGILICLSIFAAGIVVGSVWQMPRVERLPDQPQPIPDITPAPSPLDSPEPVACTTDVLVCPDGSISVRNPYDDCNYLLCSHPDGRSADTLELGRTFFTRIGAADDLVESIDLQHHYDHVFGHIYQGVIRPVHLSKMDALQKLLETELVTNGYVLSAGGRVKTEDGETVHFEKHEPLYHGFRLDRHTSSYVINFWWD